MPKTIKPKALPPGSTLGIIATSTPISVLPDATIERGYARLREMGYRIVEAPNCRTTRGHAAGTIKERVASLHAFFRDPKIDGIMAFWGGHQSHQLLEYLDYALIRRHPKALIGYSDTTALTVGIHARTGLVTFSGPAVITFCKPEVPQYTLEQFQHAISTPVAPQRIPAATTYSDNKWFEHPQGKMEFTKSTGWKTYRKGRAEGKIVVGNLGTILLLAGTPYFPDMKGALLFVEDDEVESPKTIDRMFTQLRQTGVLDQINGLVIGKFTRDVKFTQEDSLPMILDDALRGYRFPVLYDVDFGHGDPIMTIPHGIRCALDATRTSITYLEKGVR